MRTFEDDDPLFAPMLNALFAAFRGTAVMSGCAPSATGANRTISVAEGSVQINGEIIAVSAGSVSLYTGGETDRYDLISVTDTGGLTVTRGAVERKCPVQPADTCLIAIVFVPAGATVIATGNVYDARMDAPRLSVLNINAGQIGTQQYFLAPSEIPGHRVYSDLAPSTVYGTSWEAAKTVMVPANQEGAVRVRYAGTPGGTCTWRLTLNGSEVPGTSGSGESAFDQDMLISVSAGDVIAVEGHADYSTNWLTVTALEIYAIPVPNLAGIGW